MQYKNELDPNNALACLQKSQESYPSWYDLTHGSGGQWGGYNMPGSARLTEEYQNKYSAYLQSPLRLGAGSTRYSPYEHATLERPGPQFYNGLSPANPLQQQCKTEPGLEQNSSTGNGLGSLAAFNGSLTNSFTSPQPDSRYRNYTPSPAASPASNLPSAIAPVPQQPKSESPLATDCMSANRVLPSWDMGSNAMDRGLYSGRPSLGAENLVGAGGVSGASFSQTCSGSGTVPDLPYYMRSGTSSALYANNMFGMSDRPINGGGLNPMDSLRASPFMPQPSPAASNHSQREDLMYFQSLTSPFGGGSSGMRPGGGLDSMMSSQLPPHPSSLYNSPYQSRPQLPQLSYNDPTSAAHPGYYFPHSMRSAAMNPYHPHHPQQDHYGMQTDMWGNIMPDPYGIPRSPPKPIMSPIMMRALQFGKNLQEQFLHIELELCQQLRTLSFGPPVAHIYSPLEYALDPHKDYLNKFCSGKKDVLFLGMNPGPYGMVQTGVSTYCWRFLKNLSLIFQKSEKDNIDTIFGQGTVHAGLVADQSFK